MSPNKDRIVFLDGWRGLAVLCMLFFHLVWDLDSFFPFFRGWPGSVPLVALRYFIGVSFVFIAGLSSALSHSNLRRGLITLLCAAGTTVAGLLIDAPVWFGVLHLLSCCMLLCAAFGSRLRHFSGTKAVGLCLILFAAGFYVYHNVRITLPGLFWLGLRTRTFYSSDYYPLIPWAFLFFAGFLAADELLPRLRSSSLRPAALLTFPGRHALLIYMLHQPVLYGLCWLISQLCAV